LQQYEVLLRLDGRLSGGLFTEAKEPTDVIPELGERPVVDPGRPAASSTSLSRHPWIISQYDILLN